MSSAVPSVVRDFFVPIVGFVIILFAVFQIFANLTCAVYVVIFALVSALPFLLKFALPPVEKWRLDEFFNAGEADKPPVASNETRRPFIVSHRTTCLEAPENSILGITEASANGFDAVEFDVRCSKDGILVLFHDESVDRTTNSIGRVDCLTLNELKKLDISVKHLQHDKFKPEAVPTLDEAVHECRRLKLKMLIEVKVSDDNTLLQLQKFFRNHTDVLKNIMVVSFSPLLLYKIRKMEPSVLTGLVWRPRMMSMMTSTGLLEHAHPAYSCRWKQLLAGLADVLVDCSFRWIMWYLCGVAVILAHKDVMSKEFLRFWNNRGIRVLAWPVNDPLDKQYFTNVLNMSGYLTDTYLPKP